MAYNGIQTSLLIWSSLDVIIGFVIFASIYRNLVAFLTFLGVAIALRPLYIFLELIIGRGTLFYTNLFCGNNGVPNVNNKFINWVHTVHRHYTLNSSSSSNPRESLGPGMIRERYSVDDLVHDYKTFWALRHVEGLGEEQRLALKRWHAYTISELGLNIRQYPLDIDFLFELFDNVFFLGALRPYTSIEWAARSKGVAGQTDLRPIVNLWRGRSINLPWWPRSAHIKVMRLPLIPGQVWTETDVKEVIAIILHEMCHAFLNLYTCPVQYALSAEELLMKQGVTGHGSAFQEIAETLQEEAARLLGERFEGYSMNNMEAKAYEAVRVRDMVEFEGLDLSDEQLEDIPGFKEGLRWWREQGHE